MEAVVENGVVTFSRKRQVEVFRDAGLSADNPGSELQFRFRLRDGSNGHIGFHTPGRDETGEFGLFSLGSSPQSLQTASLQDALSAFRKQVQQISDNLVELNVIGATSRENALKALDIKFDGLGK